MSNLVMLKEMIRRSGLSPDEIAEKSGIPLKRLGRLLEGGEEFKASDMTALGEVLGMSGPECGVVFFNTKVE